MKNWKANTDSGLSFRFGLIRFLKCLLLFTALLRARFRALDSSLVDEAPDESAELGLADGVLCMLLYCGS